MSEKQEILVAVEAKAKRAPTLYFIVGIKLTKGVLLLLGAVSVYLLADKNLPDLFDQFLRWMHPVSYTHLDVYKRQLSKSR